jgi:hypothetical protein
LHGYLRGIFIPESSMKFIGYYTTGTPYEAEAEGLKASLNALSLDHDIRPYPNRGSWQKNTQMKSEVVRDFLDAYPNERLVYLDVDAEVKSRPVLLFDLHCDIAAAKHGGHELLSGTVYFGGTPACREVVERWIAFCQKYPERLPGGLLPHFPREDHAWDQRMLDLAVRNTACKFVELPMAYTYIQNLSEKMYPDVTPIILHTAASRRYRDIIK